MNSILIQTDSFSIEPIQETALPETLEIYRQAEDFLSLGPVGTASIEMIIADIHHSAEENGIFCTIRAPGGTLMGVLDFIPCLPRTDTGFLSLLMIATPFRGQGLGQNVVRALEDYLQKNHSITSILSGVQTNNDKGIRFWKKCGFSIDENPKKQEDGTITFQMVKRLPD
jgi:ribosomal protein S18 acetylase RimI-like enzyme